MSIKLWTIQVPEVYQIIRNKGIYTVSSQYIDKDFKRAYDWLVQQMQQRIGCRPQGVIYPIWGWYKRKGQNKKPDLRESGYAKKGQKCVLMELEVPLSEVVFTDFIAWHYVLNNSFLSLQPNETLYDEEQKKLSTLDNTSYNKAIQNSWQGVFDIEPFENEWMSKGAYVQATFWVLRKEYIKSVKFFTAK